MCYLDGSEIVYDDRLLIERKEIKMPVISGSKACVKWMEDNLKLL